MAIAKRAKFRTACSSSLILVLFLMTHANAVDLTDEEKEFLGQKKVIVFVSQTRYPPFEFIGENAQHEGMMLDVIRWIGVELGFRPVFTDTTFQQAQEAIVSGKADVLTSLFHSEKREEKFKFTDTLFEVPASIFIRSERTDIKELNDLNGKIIAIQRGDYARDFLESMGIHFDALYTDDFDQATDMVIEGKADAVIGDEQIVLYHIFSSRLTDYIKRVGEPLYIGRNCMASGKNNALLIGILNKGIRAARKSNVLDKVSKKWLGSKYLTGESLLHRYVWPMSFAVGGVLWLCLWVWVWNVRLRTLVRKKTEEIVQREEALRNSERKYRDLVEHANSIILHWSRDGRITFLNEFGLRFFGYSEAEIIGQGVMGTIVPETESTGRGLRPIMEQIGADPQTFENNINENMRRNGERVWIAWTNQVDLDSRGRVKGILSIGADITERKRAEEELRRTHNLLNMIVEHIPNMIFLKDARELRFVRFNRAGVDLLGYSREELLGKSDYDFFPKEQADFFIEKDREVLRKREVMDIPEESLLTAGGETRILHTKKVPLFDAGGEPEYLLGISEDITKRKHAEDALRESEEKYRAIFDESVAVIYVFDTHKNFINTNQAGLDLLGYSREELLQMSIPEVDADPVIVLPAGGRLLNYEHSLRRKDGSIITVLNNSRALTDSRGNVVGMLSTLIDITEQKDAENAMRASESRAKAMIQAIPDLMFRMDSQGFFLDYKADISGPYFQSEPSLMGKRNGDVLPPEIARMIDHQVRNTLETGKLQTFEYQLPVPGRGARDYEARMVASGTREVTAIVRDVTEFKQADEERRRLEERLQRAEKMEALGTLAGGVAHDLNNVLGIVVGYSELLLDDLDPSSPEKSKALEILKGGQRAAAMVQDLLTLARRGVSNRKVLNLNNVILGCLKPYEFTKIFPLQSNVRIKTDFEPNVLRVLGSAVHLEKSFINLVLNAAEAMPNGGTLSIGTRNQYLDKPVAGYDEVKEGDYVVLSVSDTGEGIPAGDLRRIFEPFYTKKVMGRSGTGLGLAVVWGTVKDHQGYINVESQEGKGTTFSLYFPVTRDDIRQEEIPASTVEYMGKGESVLVVDDVEEQRELAGAMLRKLHYTVEKACSGEEAVEYLRHHRIDLVVLDMIMEPGMDGLDAYRQMIEVHPHQKAIIVSGFAETERVRKAQALGAGAYVAKPYVLEKLGLAVRKELDRPTGTF